MAVIGVHTNAQNKPLSELISVWRHADALGYGWISISDHFPGSLGPQSNEAVATQAAMAATTSRARCGVLVYSAGFRHPAVLATAVTTIDHLSGGRAAIGLGAGAVDRDYLLYGFPLLSMRDRFDMLDESAACVAALLHDDVVRFSGRFFQIDGASNQPRPLQARLPVWLGTSGERRGLRVAARRADGWNVGFVTLDEFTRKRAALRGHCADLGRDPADVRCAVNLVVAVGRPPDSLAGRARESALTGSVEQILDGIGRYVEAGADQVNFQLPYPWDFGGLEKLATALELPAV